MRANFWMRLPETDTLLVAGPRYVRHLGRWQRWVHGLGAWLQDFAYDHSPETIEEGSDPIQFTFTEGLD